MSQRWLRWVRAPFRRVGRRGASLLFFALVFITGGIRYATTDLSMVEALRYLNALTSPRVWGAVWVAVGSLALAAAWLKRLEWAAFSALSYLCAVWAIGYAVASVGSSTPVAILTGSTIYFALCGYILLIAGWHE